MIHHRNNARRLFFLLAGLVVYPATSKVLISEQPLLSAGGVAGPNVLIDLSVENTLEQKTYPALIIQDSDGNNRLGYKANDKLNETYLGLFDPDLCYTYEGSGLAKLAGAEVTVPGGSAKVEYTTVFSQALQDSRGSSMPGNDTYFKVSGRAKTDTRKHVCQEDSWSGNFLNWYTSSKGDLARKALTGGNRARGGNIMASYGFYQNHYKEYQGKKDRVPLKTTIMRRLLGDYKTGEGGKREEGGVTAGNPKDTYIRASFSRSPDLTLVMPGVTLDLTREDKQQGIEGTVIRLNDKEYRTLKNAIPSKFLNGNITAIRLSSENKSVMDLYRANPAAGPLKSDDSNPEASGAVPLFVKRDERCWGKIGDKESLSDLNKKYWSSTVPWYNSEGKVQGFELGDDDDGNTNFDLTSIESVSSINPYDLMVKRGKFHYAKDKKKYQTPESLAWISLDDGSDCTQPIVIDPRTHKVLHQLTTNGMLVKENGFFLTVYEKELSPLTFHETQISAVHNFHAVAKVCDKDAAAQAEQCSAYPAADGQISHYKPHGVLQQYKNFARFGVMGYLFDFDAADSSNQRVRHGGVLRARLKSLVNDSKVMVPDVKGRSTEFREKTLGAEIDPETGAFVQNPDAEESPNIGQSGVINYLNRVGDYFGWRMHDPVAEMFYAGLLYLNGKESPAHYHTTDRLGENGSLYEVPSENQSYVDPGGANTKLDHPQGFPVIADWEKNPTGYSCTPTVQMVIGEPHNWRQYNLPGVDREDYEGKDAVIQTLASRNPLNIDVGTLTRFVANREGLIDGSGSESESGRPEDITFTSEHQTFPVIWVGVDNGVNNYISSGDVGRQPYLFGLSYWANALAGNPKDYGEKHYDESWKNAKRVRSIFVDIWENDLLNVGRRNAFFIAGKYGFSSKPKKIDVSTGGVSERDDSTNPFLPSGKEAGDNWSRAQVDGDAAFSAREDERMPKGFFQVSQADTMAQQLRNAFAALRDQSYLASPPVHGDVLSGRHALKVTFDNKTWTSTLAYHEVDDKGITLDTAKWKVGGGKDKDSDKPDQNKNSGERIVYTWDLEKEKGIKLSAKDKGSFSKANSRQGEWLNHDGLGRRDNQRVLRIKRLLRKTDSRSVSLYGSRNIKPVNGEKNFLGDILFSEPRYLEGRASPNKFVCPAGNSEGIIKIPMVSVAANDGLLHVFDGNNGKELFTYLPAANFDKASRWLQKDGLHEYWHDGTPWYYQTCEVGNGVGASGTSKGKVETYIIGHGGRGSSAVYALKLKADNNTAGFDKVLWEKNSWNTMQDGKQQMGMAWAGESRGSGPKVVNISGKDYVVFSSGLIEAKQAWAFAQNYGGSVFLVELESGKLTQIKLSDSDSGPNSLGEVAVFQEKDENARDGSAQTSLYVGDIQGRLWRLDHKGGSGVTGDDWFGTDKPIFMALTSSEGVKRTQAILAAPMIHQEPGVGRRLVLATGSLFSEQDRYNKGMEESHSLTLAHDGIYGLLEKGGKRTEFGKVQLTPSGIDISSGVPGIRAATTTLPNVVYLSGGNSEKELLVQSFVGNGASNSQDYQGDTSSSNIVNPESHAGWYFPLVNQYRGARSMNTPQLGTKNLGTVFMTLQLPTSKDICNEKDSTWILALGYRSGNKNSLFTLHQQKPTGNGSDSTSTTVLLPVEENMIQVADALFSGAFSEDGYITSGGENVSTSGLKRVYMKEIF